MLLFFLRKRVKCCLWAHLDVSLTCFMLVRGEQNFPPADVFFLNSGGCNDKVLTAGVSQTIMVPRDQLKKKEV